MRAPSFTPSVSDSNTTCVGYCRCTASAPNRCATGPKLPACPIGSNRRMRPLQVPLPMPPVHKLAATTICTKPRAKRRHSPGTPLSSCAPRSSNFEPRPDHEVAQRAGHQHLVRPCQCAHARADVYADSADVIAANLALAGVQPGAHFYAECLHGIADRHRTADRSLRAVEHREEAVSGRVHLTAPEPIELCPNDGVVCIKQGMPVTVAHLRGAPGRVHDVGEQAPSARTRSSATSACWPVRNWAIS